MCPWTSSDVPGDTSRGSRDRQLGRCLKFSRGWILISTSQHGCSVEVTLVVRQQQELVVSDRVTNCLEAEPYKKSCSVSKDGGDVLSRSPWDRDHGQGSSIDACELLCDS